MNHRALEKSDSQTDEGYVEQRFDEPAFMEKWTDDQKAEFAYQILLCIPVSKTINIVDRLSPLLHRDLISPLPYEIAIQIIYYLDIESITNLTGVSKRWKLLCEDQTLWKDLFILKGWKWNKEAIDHYLLSSTPTTKSYIPTTSISSIPLARTTASLYDPTTLPKMPGAPIARLKPFKRSTDSLLEKLLRNNRNGSSSNSSHRNNNNAASSSGSHATNNNNNNNNKDASSSSSSSSSSQSANNNDAIKNNNSSSSSNSNIDTLTQGLNSLTLRPTQVLSSRSQPITRSNNNTRAEALSHTIVERPFLNRPSPSSRRHVKYDETAIYHYKENFDTRYINWKRLYRNRIVIEKRWQEGKCKIREFPPVSISSSSSTSTINEALLQQHNGGIYCLQFNHSILVTGSRDRNLKIWDIKTGRLKSTLEGHTGSVLCLQFDDRYLITGSSDSTLIVWNIYTTTGIPKKVKELMGHGESVLNVKFHENTVVSCSKDRTVRIWNLEQGTLEMTLRGHRAAVNAVQFKGDKIVSASGDRTIKMWDRNTGKCLKTLDNHSRGIACVEYDGKYIISGSSDQTIRVWDAITGDCIHTLEGHSDLVRTLQLDSKSQRIVSGSYDGTLKIWSLQDGKLLKSFNQVHHGRILNLQFDFGRIVCCSNLGKIAIYDFAHHIDTQFLL